MLAEWKTQGDRKWLTHHAVSAVAYMALENLINIDPFDFHKC